MPALNPQGIPVQSLNNLFYVYDFAFLTVAASTTYVLTQTVQQDSNFLWQMTTVFGYKDGVTTAASDAIIHPFTIQVSDSGTSRQFFSTTAGIPVDLVAGIGKFPFVLPQPYLFQAVSVIQVSLTNLDSAQWDNVHLSFIGKKIYLTQ
jgi:hypothetical protein